MSCLLRRLGLLSLLLAGACAAGPATIPERYRVPDLEPVPRIDQFRLYGWNKVDRQSLVVQTKPRRWYLLVLCDPNPDLYFTERIVISSTALQVRAGFDTVTAVRGNGLKTIRTIGLIYEFNDRDQLRRVTAPLRAASDESAPAPAGEPLPVAACTESRPGASVAPGP